MDYTLLDIDFLQDYDLENEKIENVSSEIIFSLTSIPTRFIHKQFEKTIQSLYNQTYKPKYIIINLCNVYNRNFDYDKNTFESKIQYYKQNYDNIIINFSEDYGPITKILGLYKMHDFLKPEDKIIVIDDDVVYKPSVTYYYDLAYQMYNCDSVFIDELQILPQFLSDKNVYNIVSCDTSNPVVAAIHELRYDAEYGLQTKPKTKLADLIEHNFTEDQLQILTYNLKMFKRILYR